MCAWKVLERGEFLKVQSSQSEVGEDYISYKGPTKGTCKGIFCDNEVHILK